MLRVCPPTQNSVWKPLKKNYEYMGPVVKMTGLF